jgi:hypothetical protein
MTPKEKAKELVDMMSKQTYQYQEYAGAKYTTSEIGYEGGKKCALVTVHEILKDKEEIDGMRVINDPYWLEVKQEIEKL